MHCDISSGSATLSCVVSFACGKTTTNTKVLAAVIHEYYLLEAPPGLEGGEGELTALATEKNRV